MLDTDRSLFSVESIRGNSLISLISLILVTEEEEAVANNTGWSPRDTPNFDLTGSGK